jgi:hypothetical protein
MTNSLVEEESDYQNVRYSTSRPRLSAASGAEDDMIVVVVGMVVNVVELFEFGDDRGQSSSHGIGLLRWEVLGLYIVGG